MKDESVFNFASRARRAPDTPRGQRTRQRLSRAAETVFGEKGYEHASVVDITREAEVALGRKPRTPRSESR